jgi:plastocyanin domain-containing protein
MKLAMTCLTLVANATGCERQTAAPTPAASATASSSMPAAGLQPVRVEVSSSGFQPARAVLGACRTLVFRRTTESTCATSVVFPALGIDKSLPLNTDVSLELPVTLKDDVSFQCGMGMLRGKVVVR